jgi:hypothetical protein
MERRDWLTVAKAFVAVPFVLAAALIAVCGAWYGAVTIADRANIFPNPFDDLPTLFEIVPPPTHAQFVTIEVRQNEEGWVNFYGSDVPFEQTAQNYSSEAKLEKWTAELRFSTALASEQLWFSPETPNEESLCIAIAPYTALYSDPTITLERSDRAELAKYAHPYLVDLRRCGP